MFAAAERMRTLGERASDGGAPSSIFGSAASLAQSIHSDDHFRVSFYPIICSEAPETAMGLAACLAYLLEQYDDVRVYRPFAKIGLNDGGDISREDYQFAPDDWELEGLADNVLIHGDLQVRPGSLKLRLSLDASLADSRAPGELDYAFESLTAAVSALPDIAAEIIAALAGRPSDQATLRYQPLAPGDHDPSAALEAVFDWNLDVYLHLWGAPWAEADVRAQFQDMAAICREQPSEFAYWRLGMMAKQVMQPGLGDIGDFVAPLIDAALIDGAEAWPGRAALALGFSALDMHQRAINLLQPHLSSEAPAAVYAAMIEIFLAASYFADALSTSQIALESGNAHPWLAWQYAQLLISAEANSWEIEEVLLIDPEEADESDHIALEIASALKLYIERSPHNLEALQLALFYMIDGEDDELWLYFERMIRVDSAGDFAGEVVDRLLDLDDIEPGVAALERHLDSNPYACVFLAQIRLADGDYGAALELVAHCRRALAEVDDNLEIELQRVEIAAKLPDFDAAFAEMKLSLSANRAVPGAQIDMLEEAIEAAPMLVDLYVTLARAYLGAKDFESALEVLTEAEDRAGPHPQIELALSQLLWSGDQRQGAVEKLNGALERFPSDVALLAQMANFLIANDQLESARQYIARAEIIAPSHRAVGQLRRLVAQKVAP